MKYIQAIAASFNFGLAYYSASTNTHSSVVTSGAISVGVLLTLLFLNSCNNEIIEAISESKEAKKS